jgi:hypothetical protein
MGNHPVLKKLCINMTFSELKAKIIRACGTTVLNRQLIEKPTEAGFKKILRSCTIPGFQKYIRQYFETVLGKTPETQPDPIVDVKIVTEDEPVEVEEIPTEEPVIVTEDEPVNVEETVEEQTEEVVEQPTDEPVEEMVQEKVDEVVEEQTEVIIPDESIEEQPEPVDDQAADVVEQPTDEPVEEMVEAKPKKRKGRKK